ncbi:hypothetical protein M7I_7066 [Glarea lozoyensis 74030]|uniref:Uncharacterized protein n=1 Tax=Glarea lozoyensis (strain ATCC 74030 / MF5533) TaxID=1104152 RepID=H0EWA3_GLAL7|nr:hypothetical protein M7I_7066 [Glarea lozoyensis 74030]
MIIKHIGPETFVHLSLPRRVSSLNRDFVDSTTNRRLQPLCIVHENTKSGLDTDRSRGSIINTAFKSKSPHPPPPEAKFNSPNPTHP